MPNLGTQNTSHQCHYIMHSKLCTIKSTRLLHFTLLKEKSTLLDEAKIIILSVDESIALKQCPNNLLYNKYFCINIF